MKEKRQGFQEVFDTDFIYDYVKTVTSAEKKWSDYLLDEGELAGYNRNINNAFIDYFADKTMTDIGLEPIYNTKKNDTIDWYNNYRKIKNQNTALQETSNTSYNKGVIQNDIRLNIGRLRENYKG
jgi:ribonucleoside-diphosphate reductase beta chain